MKGDRIMETQAVVALVIGVAVIFFVPALVWSATIAGLYQTIRAKVQKSVKRVLRRVPVSTK
jgi:hypothetical protein